MYGHQEAWSSGIGLEFLAKSQDVVIDGASGRIVLITPNLIEKLFARNDSTSGRSKIFQQLEFLCRKRDQPSGVSGFHTGEIDAGLAKNQDLVIDGFGGNLGNGGRIGAGATHGTADAGEKLPGAERFSDVVVGAKFKEEDFVFDFGIGAEDDDGNRGGQRLEFAAELLAGLSRELEIEDDRGRSLLAKELQTSQTVGCDLHLQGIGFKQPLERTLHGATIFDN
jgi:hypothetical protein